MALGAGSAEISWAALGATELVLAGDALLAAGFWL